MSVTRKGDQWKNGVCEARCLNPSGRRGNKHQAPQAECHCGVYGCMSLARLYPQWPKQTNRLLTVIAAEGKTIMGPTGFKTAAARVVAWWSPVTSIQALAERQFKGAQEFGDPYEMCKAFELNCEDITLSPPADERVKLLYPAAWLIWSVGFVCWDTHTAIRDMEQHVWWWGGFSWLSAMFMAGLAYIWFDRLRAAIPRKRRRKGSQNQVPPSSS